MRIATWNVNGIRARHAEVVRWASEHSPDILCLQEIKATPEQVPERLTTLPEYWSLWHGLPGGYSGVSIHLKQAACSTRPTFRHPHFDHEGRVVEAVIGDVVFCSMYVPNGGKDYVAKIAFVEALIDHAARLAREGRQLILCGDLNIAREERDVHPGQRDARLVGQRPEERALFERLLAAGLCDVGRQLNPEDDRYFTWWPFWRKARENNIGWRLDYLLASPALAARARSTEVFRGYGTSDHAPVVFTFDALELGSA